MSAEEDAADVARVLAGMCRALRRWSPVAEAADRSRRSSPLVRRVRAGRCHREAAPGRDRQTDLHRRSRPRPIRSRGGVRRVSGHLSAEDRRRPSSPHRLPARCRLHLHDHQPRAGLAPHSRRRDPPDRHRHGRRGALSGAAAPAEAQMGVVDAKVFDDELFFLRSTRRGSSCFSKP